VTSPRSDANQPQGTAATADPAREGASTPRPGDLPAVLLDDIFRQELLDHGPALYVADLQGNLQWTNSAFRRLAAAAAEPETPAPAPLLPLPEIAAEIGMLGSMVFREDTVRIGGTLQRLRSRHVALRDAAGKVGAIAGIVQSMPEDSQRLELIALLRERLDDITRLASDWIWETDPDLGITAVSQRITEVLGYHPRELTGRSLLSLGGDPESRDALTARFAQHSPFRDQMFEATTRDGEMKLFLLSAVPVFSSATGALTGFRGTASDITELKRRELGLRAAKEMAEMASRAKTEFLANMSHELRTPLNAIIGFTEIMKMELLGPMGNQQYFGYASDIHDSARHLLGLINDILDVSKIEAGKATLIEEDVALDRVFDSVIRLIRERAQRADVKLATDLPEGLPGLRADERKLKQILINLLSNAVKFTPPGGRAELAARIDRGGDLVITVTDTGIGIAAQDIERVMEPFGQVDSRLSRRFSGTGLGLPLSRALAEMHGGSLTLESEPGKGTTVAVRLPAARFLPRTPAAPSR
jgi:PAS domain S-box-containing protein